MPQLQSALDVTSPLEFPEGLDWLNAKKLTLRSVSKRV